MVNTKLHEILESYYAHWSKYKWLPFSALNDVVEAVDGGTWIIDIVDRSMYGMEPWDGHYYAVEGGVLRLYQYDTMRSEWQTDRWLVHDG